jgi:PspAB-like protein
LGLADVLFGRKKLKKADEQKLFAIATARITLETELGLKPSGAAAVVFKPLSAADFVRAENEVQELLDTVAQESHSRVERRGDEFGFEWLIIHDNDFEELVPAVHLVASELVAHGFGEQLLAAAFRFESKLPVYLIYGFKRGAFWPFIPKGDGKERDNAEELELKAKLEKELPIEQDLTRWLALFDAPI